MARPAAGAPKTREGRRMKIWCGIDWAEHHHDIAVVDEAGTLLVKRRIGDDLDGFGQLIGVLTELAGAQHLEVPVAMETANGLFGCIPAGRGVLAVRDQSARGVTLPRSLLTEPRKKRCRRRLRVGQY